MPDWQPTASLQALTQRNALLQALRHYLTESSSLEVQTPALSSAAATDPYIDSFTTEDKSYPLWLHTSPEFPMKRLLAAYQIDVHQFATVFRQDESGRYHNREFTMLEWYRVDANLDELVQDAVALVNTACIALNKPPLDMREVSYTESVKNLCGVYPEQVSLSDISAVFSARNRSFPESLLSNKADYGIDDALTLLVDEFIVSEFAENEITVLTEYPVSQASLAKTTTNSIGQSIALRAEIFIGQVELANGFEELTDAVEQQRRFQRDNAIRNSMDKAQVPHDKI